MKKIERRDLFKIAGGAVAGGLVGTTVSFAPFDALQWLVEWTQDQYRPEGGEEKFRPSVCPTCGTDISVRLIGERAVKIETANAGCSVCQTLIQLLYHPERIQRPLKRVGEKGSGRFAPIEWDEAILDIANKIKWLRIQNKANMIAAIDGSNCPVTRAVWERFCGAIGTGHLYCEPTFDELSSVAVRVSQNVNGTIDYDFENSNYVLSFGARLFEGWGNHARMHRLLNMWKANNTTIVQIDSLATRTASLATKWIPVKPGTEIFLALGIAYKLIMNYGKGGNLPELARWNGLNDFAPDKVSEITGVPVEKIDEISREFANASRAVAVAGRGGKMVSSSIAEILAVQCLNKLTGRLGVPGGVYIRAINNRMGAVAQDAIARAGIQATQKSKGLDDFIKNGEKVELLIINGANPVHRSVFGNDFVNKLKEIPMVIAITALRTETAACADYILPACTILESQTVRGNAAVRARFAAKHPSEIVLRIAKAVEGIAQSFPWDAHSDIANLISFEKRSIANFVLNIDVLRSGIESIKKKMESAMPLSLVPYEIPLVGNGSGLAFPYVLKGIGQEDYAFERMRALMNPETAAAHGVGENSTIRIKSPRGKTGRVKVHLTKTVPLNTIAIALGFGHRDYTKYGSGKGINPLEIMAAEIDSESGVADWWFTRVNLS
ncbi:MAG: molybdopterin-dependent oxidoreductase [Spirochaetes bacterium]|nr:molybdopterin-dependent oxidoreductase [Spirochaetota bacterium]